MHSSAKLGLTLLLASAAALAVERSHELAAPSQTATLHSARASELEAGSDSVESLSQTALEQRLDQLENELSAGNTGFPSSGHTPADPPAAGFGLD